MNKILMILDNPYRPDVRVKKEIDTINSLGYEVDLFCWDKEGVLPPKVQSKMLKIFRLRVLTKSQQGIKQISRLFLFYKMLLKSVRKESNYLVIYVHDFLMLPIGVFFKYSLKTQLIYDAHEIYHIMEWEKYNLLIRAFIKHTEKNLIKFVDYFIVVSSNRRDYYKKYIKKEIVVLGNWYDTYEGENVDLKKELHINKTELLIGYFGGLNKRARLLDYMVSSCNNINGCHLVIAGSGVDSGYIEEISKKYSRIHFLGWEENIHKFIDSLDYMFYLLSESREYFKYTAPNTLYLAVSHAVPLLTNVPGEPEDLIKKYDIGFMINPNIDLSKQIELDNYSTLYLEKKINAEKIRSDYQWSSSSTIYTKIFNDISRDK